MSGLVSGREAWQWLTRELDRWSETGRQARFWWRDDDAVSLTPDLERLLELGRQRQIPLALAVIPALAHPDLGRALTDYDRVTVLQHGYRHRNHAAEGQRKLELGGERAVPDLCDDLRRGHDILQRNCGDLFHPVLVPPWNRIEPKLLGHLAAVGLRGISMHRARRDPFPAAQLLQVNTHLDPINWRHGGGFIGLFAAIAILVQHLSAKRLGYRDASEATGILTHHLVQNPATWRFVENLLSCLQDHAAVSFVGAAEIWR